MGASLSRREAGIQELDFMGSNAYRYPPRNGKYFASHFIMGGEKFQTTEPEMYLFGENMDLNFLSGKPSPFPYAAPQPNEPTRTLRSLINIRKESLRFVKVADAVENEGQITENASTNTLYNIEFSFDSDVQCNITIYYFCSEEITANGVVYTSQDASLNSETYYYKKGISQQFSQQSHVFDPSKYSEEQLSYRYENEIIPLLIQCVSEEGDDPRQSHMVIAVVEKNADETYTLKPLKQKLFVDGLCYLLEEIYGIENKNVCQSDLTDEDVEDTGFDCVICMSDPRDTLILPCRHLCLCNSCADSLRYQANNCPICRAPFRALLQIRAVRKSNSTLPQISHNTDNQTSQDIPPGYEPVSLIEALNGPIQPSALLVPSFVPASIQPFANNPGMQQKHRHLNRHYSSSVSLRLWNNSNSEKDSSSSGILQGHLEGSSVPEVVASVLSPDKTSLKIDSSSLTRSEGSRHKKGFRTSFAPEKMRLLTNSVNTVNDVGNKEKFKKDSELAETRSLLEGNIAVEDNPGTLFSPKISRPCNRSKPISLSTPHSLYLCEKSIKDTSPCRDDSDYFTLEGPGTTISVHQSTDTSLDTPQTMDLGCVNKVKGDCPVSEKLKVNQEQHTVVKDLDHEFKYMHDKRKRNSDPLNKVENPWDSLISPKSCSLVVNLENHRSLPGTPVSNVSNQSSGDSFSSTSSSRLLLRPQSYDTLQE